MNKLYFVLLGLLVVSVIIFGNISKQDLTKERHQYTYYNYKLK